MADRTALGIIGYIFSGVTAVVVLLGVVVVSQYIPEPASVTQAQLSAKAR